MSPAAETVLPEERRLSRLAGEGESVSDGLREVARQLAAAHLDSRPGPAALVAATAASALVRWEEVDAELVAMRSLLAEPMLVAECLGLARRYLAGREALFAERIEAGRVVGGGGSPSSGDGLAGVATLVVDLELQGAQAGARRLLRWYAEFAGDHWPASLADFYLGYQSLSQAVNACRRASASGLDEAPAADRLVRLAARHLRAGQVALVLVGGQAATGRSALARRVANDGGTALLCSDRVRRQLVGGHGDDTRALTSAVWEPALASLTSGELLRRAESALERGETVVLDAPWDDPVWRSEARRLADRVAAELVEICCQAPPEILVRRSRATASGHLATDGNTTAGRAADDPFPPWPEARIVDTSLSLSATARMTRLFVADDLLARSRSTARLLAGCW